MRRVASLPLLLAAACSVAPPPATPALPSAAAPPAPARASRFYEGVLELPGGVPPAEFVLEVHPTGSDTWEGRVHFPGQTFEPMPATVTVESEAVAVTVESLGATWTLTGSTDATTLACAFRQSGIDLSCDVERIDEEDAKDLTTVVRPQTPKPPYPYAVREVVIQGFGRTNLSGTLTLPEGDGPFPAVALLTGSGAQDRDETLFGHRPFHVLADHLSRHGIAVLRTDDRGVGKSEGNLERVTVRHLAADAVAMVEFLAEHETIDPARVGLLGHSEGGVVAPLAATMAPKQVHFVVMMAGTAVPLSEVLVAQGRASMKQHGFSEADLEVKGAWQEKLFELLRAKKPDAAAIDAHIRLDAKNLRQPVPADAVVEANRRALMSANFVSFLDYDPGPTLARVSCPVLALQGTLDLQVLPSQNLPVIEAALAKSKHPASAVKVLEGLNHVFQHAKTGAVSEYATLSETLAPELLETVQQFIAAR